LVPIKEVIISNRYHSKWHRHHHHTYGTVGEPDSARDPIASREDPFRGDLVLDGALSASAPLSAYAGTFYTNATNATTIISHAQGTNSTGMYASGQSTGVLARSPSGDAGDINIDEFGNTNVDFPNFGDGYLGISVEGNALVSHALSASSIWTNAIYANSAVLLVTDLHVSELSGFTVMGTDYRQDVPATIDPDTEQLFFLQGIGISGTSWASFGGDIQTNSDLIVSGNTNIGGNLTVGGDIIGNTISTDGDIVGDNGYFNGNLTAINGFFSGDVSAINADFTGDVDIGGDLTVGGGITADCGTSEEWCSTYTTVSANSATWGGYPGSEPRITLDPLLMISSTQIAVPSPPIGDIADVLDADNNTNWGPAGFGSRYATFYWDLGDDYTGHYLIDATISGSGATLIGVDNIDSQSIALTGGSNITTGNIVGYTLGTAYNVSKIMPFYGRYIGFRCYSVPGTGSTATVAMRRFDVFGVPVSETDIDTL
jgi:hypothetical protein